ncbi:MAG TPA: hypothetical protein VHX17_13535 [Candidatus Cybelea sp.]|nr:hypothetical protein [Candidatus Cybelea sp.]
MEEGCAADLGAIRRLVAGPLHDAEAQMRDEIASLGVVEPVLRHNLLAQAMNSIAERGWEKVFANVGLRFRARFSIYTDALLQAQERFVAEAGLTRRELRGRRPRKIIAPRVLVPNMPSLALAAEGTEVTVQSAMAQFERFLRDAIAEEVERARTRLMNRGRLSLARTRLAVCLAEVQGSASPAAGVPNVSR